MSLFPPPLLSPLPNRGKSHPCRGRNLVIAPIFGVLLLFTPDSPGTALFLGPANLENLTYFCECWNALLLRECELSYASARVKCTGLHLWPELRRLLDGGKISTKSEALFVVTTCLERRRGEIRPRLPGEEMGTFLPLPK